MSVAEACRERVQRCLDQIARLNETLGAIITPMGDRALEDAARCDAAAAQGHWLGVLHGMPVTVKDNIDTAGTLTTSGSRFFSTRVPAEDAPVVARLRQAGAVVVGKANMSELAYGTTTANEAYGDCRNPWDTARVPGGSSGGSAVAVATGMCAGSLGTDTGGSVRIPAALNGVTGLRPTFGRVPNIGTTPLVPDLDSVGPLARRVEDVARIFAVIDGSVPDDPWSTPGPRPQVLTGLHDGIDGLRIGVSESFFFEDIEHAVESAVRVAMDTLARLGARIVPVVLPGVEDVSSHMAKILPATAAAVHRERLDADSQQFGTVIRRRLRMGLEISAADYAEAVIWRRGWRRTVERAFADVDLIVSPTVPVTAPVAEPEESDATAATLTRLCRPWSMAGVPAISLPCGFDAHDLPIGLQLAAPAGNEHLLFRAGVAYQDATDWHLRTPNVEEVQGPHVSDIST